MGLQAEPPLRVLAAVVDGEARIPIALNSVHRLEEKVLEVETLEFLWRSP